MAQLIKIVRSSSYFSVHTHSRYSFNDAMPTVADDRRRGGSAGVSGPGDHRPRQHGRQSVELYQACARGGDQAVPGQRAVLRARDRGLPGIAREQARSQKATMYHLGVVAYTTQGYRNLVRLSTASHHNHHYKPLVDYAMLAQLAEDGANRGPGGDHRLLLRLPAPDPDVGGRRGRSARSFSTPWRPWFPDSTYVEVQNHHIAHEEGLDDEQLADCAGGTG